MNFPPAVSHRLEFPGYFSFLRCQKQFAVSKCSFCPFPTPYAAFGLYRHVLEGFAFRT